MNSAKVSLYGPNDRLPINMTGWIDTDYNLMALNKS